MTGQDILATKKVTFGLSILNRPISATVDSDRNNGVTSFVKNNPVLIDVITEAGILSMFSNYGTLVQTSTDKKTITENVAFVNTNQATISNIPSSDFSYIWLGSKIGGSLEINRVDNILTMSSIGTGLIQVTYKVNIKIFTLSKGRKSVLCVFTNADSNSANVIINFSESSCDTEAGPTIITVVDYTTGLPVSGAVITIDGFNKGSTGSNGKLNVGSLSTGLHSISVQKSGYEATGNDCIDNSDFTL